MNVLDSKLMIPKRRDILHRKRLTRLFKENSDKKLFAVTAGAGFGKTTLVVDALNQIDLTPVWYRLDEQDTDFHVFMSYLYNAVGRQFGQARQAEIMVQSQLSGIKSQTAVLMAWLSFVQKQIQRRAAIILDDYHLVQHSQAVNSAVEFILHRLPDHIQMILIGRKRLPLGLSRLRVQEKLVEIQEDELCFSDHEIERFFDRMTGITRPHVEQILQTTRGWAASLVLLRYTLSKKSTTTVTASLAKLTKRPDLLFAYLKENVFDFQPAHTRDFMMKAALLPDIDSKRCRTIFDVEHAERILERMLEDHLMIFPVDDSATVFRLHHLFRDFLIEQLHDHFTADDIARLHCRIAEAYASHDIYLALEHFVEGKQYDRALQLIEANELEFLLRGRVNFLDGCLNRVPKNIVEKKPKLLLSQARICSHFGNPEKAMELTSRALKLFQRRNEKDQMVECFIELGMQYYYTGHLKEAKLLMEQVLGSIAHDSQAYIITMTFLTFFPKDFLVELLWPEQNPEKTGSRFNMAMSALRKTLEPGLAAKAPSSYIDRKKDAYRIFSDRCNVDVQKFSSLFLEAGKAHPDTEKALGLYLEACELYRGEFLEEDRYEQWCEEIRQNLSRQYLQMLQAVSAIFEDRKDFESAIFYARKLLDTAPLNEDVLMKLMQIYSKSGAVSKIIAVYETYTAHAAELDCPVSDEIATLFKNLVKI